MPSSKYLVLLGLASLYLLLNGCRPSDGRDYSIATWLQGKIAQIQIVEEEQKEKKLITQALNTFFQCRYDYSARKEELCSHILLVPEEAKVASEWLGAAFNSKYSQDELASMYFKFYALVVNVLNQDKPQALAYQIIDLGIDKACTKLGRYEIKITEDRRNATVWCGHEKPFQLEYSDHHWRVILQK
ncbi:MAG: hypothetical protein WDW21_03050 [Neisseriaceae bacterium]